MTDRAARGGDAPLGPTWPQSLLSGGSEIGRRILARDWSDSPMGPIEAWPQSLRTVLLTCLESRFPTFVYWGPSLVQFYNDAGRPVMGARDRTDAFGTPIDQVFPALWPTIGPMFDAVMSAGRATWAEDQLLMMERNGFVEETYLTWSYSPIRDESGRVGGILCSVIEVTRQVVGERRLKLLREMAFRTAGKATVAEVCRECMAVLGDNHPDIPFAVLRLRSPGDDTARYVGSFGIEVPERSQHQSLAVYHPVFDEVARTREAVLVSPLPEDAFARRLSPDAEAASSALVLPITLTGETVLGGFLSVGLSPNRPLDDDYRSFLNLLVGQIATAVSSARSQEEARRRAEDLARLDRAKTAFFSNISHEFRTPLTLLLGPLEEALARARGEARVDVARDSLESARRNAGRLLKLVNALLEFSRVEAGRVEACFERVDLASYTQELASQFASVMQRGGLAFRVHAAQPAQPVYVDRAMWEKIVFNLLSNAFKFTFAGGEVALTLEGEGDDAAVLRVRDTGAGIAQEELGRVFERFHRVQNARSRSFEGSGIGLALVQELVKLHGGTISVQSELGRGTTFTVRVPTGRAHLRSQRVRSPNDAPQRTAEPFLEEAARWMPDDAADAPDEARAAGDAADAAAGAAAARRTVLVVDDNADMRAHIARLLAPAYRVETAVHGLAALAAIAKRAPDLVITDVMMPELDGFELLRRVRADEATRRIPVIVLSARAGDEATIEGLECGADDYLVKPFSPRELLARVRTQISMGDLRRDLDAEKQAHQAREEAVRMRDQFLSIASHELKTPLTTLSLRTQMRARALERGNAAGFAPEKLAKMFAEDERQIQRLTRLVDDMLDVSRLRTQTFAIQREPLELGALVAEVVARFEPEFRRAGTPLSFAAAGAAHGQWDRYRLEQVVANLLTNALKYGARRPVLVRVAAAGPGGCATLTVQDHGPGIARDDQARIFQQFERAVADSAVSGLGLGLFITRQIVEAHGGAVRVESEPGAGARFVVELPAAATSAVAADVAQAPDAP